MKRRIAVLLVVAAVAGSVWYFGGQQLSVERMAERELELRAVLEDDPLVAWLVAFAVYTVVSLFPGTSGKSIVCGWLFGFWQSLLMVTVSLTIAAVVGFLLARYLLRDVIRSLLGKRVESVDRRLQREGAFYLLTLRMLHVPYTFVNYASGASGVSLRTFAWTTCVGLIPSTMIFVGLGSSLPTLHELQEEGAHGLLSPVLLFALVAMGAAPWLVRWVVRRVRPDAAALSEARRSRTTRASS